MRLVTIEDFIAHLNCAYYIFYESEQFKSDEDSDIKNYENLNNNIDLLNKVTGYSKEMFKDFIPGIKSQTPSFEPFFSYTPWSAYSYTYNLISINKSKYYLVTVERDSVSGNIVNKSISPAYISFEIPIYNDIKDFNNCTNNDILEWINPNICINLENNDEYSYGLYHINTELDINTYFSKKELVYKGTDEYICCFTTYEEAEEYINSIPATIARNSQYEKIIEVMGMIKPFSKDALTVIESYIEECKSLQMQMSKLNPLQLCREYLNSVNDSIGYISYMEKDALYEYICDRDYHRYETVYFNNIFENIIDKYDDNVKWVNIKKNDKAIIKAMAEYVKQGYNHVLFDW